MAPRRIPLAEAFAAQGVTLQDERRSRSGVRWHDGGVVIAIRDSDVLVSFDGFSCLLWTPRLVCPNEWLAHCRLAALHGGADGLLVCGGAAQVAEDALLALRVEKCRGEYWALWGSPVRAASLGYRGRFPAASPLAA